MVQKQAWSIKNYRYIGDISVGELNELRNTLVTWSMPSFVLEEG
jgi:hypothetical protein